mgnify:CR=1 FL=1
MGKIFCVMGKSASGKDTIYNKIMQDDSLMLSRIIPYTTRPIRDGETQDKDYHFCNEEDVKRLSAQGRIIELREYNTVYGVWKYFTVNDDDIDLRCKSYLTVGTLESYTKIRDYFGSDKVLPIYVEVEDGDRLIRAIHREKGQQVPKYEEMCRRFLADEEDFSEENLIKSGITERFGNEDFTECLNKIQRYIEEIR